MKKDSTFLLVFIFIVLGVVILSGAVYLYKTGSPKKSPTAEPTPSIETQLEQPVSAIDPDSIPKFTWETYVNDDHGYGFQYPNTWKLTEKSTSLTLANPNGSKVFSLEIVKQSYDQAKKKLGQPGVAEGDLNTTPVVIEQKENRTTIYTFAAKSDEEVVKVTLFGNLSRDDIEYSLLQQVMATVHKI